MIHPIAYRPFYADRNTIGEFTLDFDGYCFKTILKWMDAFHNFERLHLFMRSEVLTAMKTSMFGFSPEYGGSTFLRNVGIYLQVHTAL
jgi:hypothetical protein